MRAGKRPAQKLQARRPKPRPKQPRKVSRRLGGAPERYARIAGDALGGLAGRAFERITGMGEYKVHSNSVMTNNAPAKFSADRDYVTIRHREFVSLVHGSKDFKAIEHNINPANPLLFPWLSQIAGSFESFAFRGLVMDYQPTSGVAVAGDDPALGAVIMSTAYDVNKKPFGSRREMEAYEFTVSTVPYRGVLHPVECDPSLLVLDKLYVDTRSRSEWEDLTPNGDPVVADRRFHDHGNFFIATDGQVSNGDVLGELWATYEIRLYLPRLAEPSEGVQHHGLLDVDTTYPLGASPYIYPNSARIAEIDHTLKTLTFPEVGEYSVHILCAGVGMQTIPESCSLELVTGAWTLQSSGAFYCWGGPDFECSWATTDGRLTYFKRFRITTPDTVLVFNQTVTGTPGFYRGDIFIRRLPPLTIGPLVQSLPEKSSQLKQVLGVTETKETGEQDAPLAPPPSDLGARPQPPPRDVEDGHYVDYPDYKSDASVRSRTAFR